MALLPLIELFGFLSQTLQAVNRGGCLFIPRKHMHHLILCFPTGPSSLQQQIWAALVQCA